MCPDVSRFRVDPRDGLEALDGRERRAVPKVEEVVVLEPLRQPREVHHFPGLQLVPNGDRKLLGLLRGVVHHPADVVAPVVVVAILVLFRDAKKRLQLYNKHLKTTMHGNTFVFLTHLIAKVFSP